MKQTFISQIAPHLGKKTIIKGWVYNKRFSGKIGFLQIRDGSGFIQGVISEKEVESGTWDLGNKLTLESSVIVHGTVTKHPRHEVY